MYKVLRLIVVVVAVLIELLPIEGRTIEGKQIDWRWNISWESLIDFLQNYAKEERKGEKMGHRSFHRR